MRASESLKQKKEICKSEKMEESEKKREKAFESEEKFRVKNRILRENGRK